MVGSFGALGVVGRSKFRSRKVRVLFCSLRDSEWRRLFGLLRSLVWENIMTYSVKIGQEGVMGNVWR